MATGDVFDRFQHILPEMVEMAVDDLIIGDEPTDPLYQFVQSSRQVTKLGKTTDSTPGYEAEWTMLVQRGGMAAGATFGASTVNKMGSNSRHIMGQSANDLTLDPTLAPKRSYERLKSRLRKMKGVYVIDQEDIDAMELSAPFEDLVQGATEDVTLLLRKLWSAIAWGAGNGVIGYAGAAASLTTSTVVAVPIAQAQIFRFIPGQRYVFAESDLSAPIGGTAIEPAVARCIYVDDKRLKVGFQCETTALSVDAGDAIVYADMYDFVGASSLACNGIESLLISSGNFPDTSIAVSGYPQLQAFIEGDSTMASPENPEPEIIDEIVSRMMQSDPMTPPALFAEDAVWLLWSHLERRHQSIVSVPQGVTFNAAGGVLGPVISSGGKMFAKVTSNCCRPNTIFGLDAATFTRYGPGDQLVHWRTSNGGASGVPAIFRSVPMGTRLTNMYAADFHTFGQLANRRPSRNLIRHGLNNVRDYQGWTAPA